MSLEERIHYTFKDKSLLELAFLHPSLPTKNNQTPINNQRLEFLGDSVLGLVIAEWLYALYADENEGDLAKRHAALVCGKQLVEIGNALELGEALQMSGSEADSDGRKTASNIEDACEALIGAIYLDGGLEAAKAFIHAWWEKPIKTTKVPPKDPKTALQEWAQGEGLGLPEYVLVTQSGPSHAPEFTVSLEVKGYDSVEGKGASKKEAERNAAETLLKLL